MLTEIQDKVVRKARRIAKSGGINLEVAVHKDTVCVGFEDGTNGWSIYVGPNGGLAHVSVVPVDIGDGLSEYVRNIKKAERFVRYGRNILGRDSDRLLSFGPLVEAVNFADKARNFVLANGMEKNV